jgi:methanogenic corrinoid protein MtbC1
MYPSALRVRDVVNGLAARGSKAKVVVGGAPFRLDAKLGEAVGADRVGRTASDALRIVAELARGA